MPFEAAGWIILGVSIVNFFLFIILILDVMKIRDVLEDSEILSRKRAKQE